MARILYLEPASTDLFAAHYQQLLDGAASPGTEVDVRHLPVPGASPAPSFWNAGYQLEGEMFKNVKEAEEEGYSAVIIGCSADPGLDIAKRLAKIPVVGPLEAGLHTGSMLAQRMAIITPGPLAEVRWLEDRARLYGLRHKITSIRQVDTGRPSVFELGKRVAAEPGAVREIVLNSFRSAVTVPGQAADHIRQAIEEEGIGAVYFSCTCFSGMLGALAREFKIPLLDPVVVALRAAEVLVKATERRE
jgi:allantoin racemase